MFKKTLDAGSARKVRVLEAQGDLRVTGWDRDEISARTDEDELALALNGEEVTVSCQGDLILTIPRRLALDLETVAGDADVREFPSGVSIGEVEGDLSLRMVGPANVATVMGDMEARESGPLTIQDIHADLSVRGGKGDLSIQTVEGDISLHEIQGNVNVTSAMDDLYVRGVSGNLNARVEGDAVLYLQPSAGQAVSVEAEGDILLHMPARAGASLSLAAGDADDIRVEMPGVPKRDGTNPRALVLGGGGAAISLKAEGDVMVTSRESDWASAAEFDFGGGWPLPADFSERINRRVQESTQRAQRHAEAAMRRAEENMRRTEESARRQHGRRFSFNWSSGRVTPPVSPVEPVSDEERMTILRMLQEKKISAEDAEKLLSALEGGS